MFPPCDDERLHCLSPGHGGPQVRDTQQDLLLQRGRSRVKSAFPVLSATSRHRYDVAACFFSRLHSHFGLISGYFSSGWANTQNTRATTGFVTAQRANGDFLDEVAAAIRER